MPVSIISWTSSFWDFCPARLWFCSTVPCFLRTTNTKICLKGSLWEFCVNELIWWPSTYNAFASTFCGLSNIWHVTRSCDFHSISVSWHWATSVFVDIRNRASYNVRVASPAFSNRTSLSWRTKASIIPVRYRDQYWVFQALHERVRVVSLCSVPSSVSLFDHSPFFSTACDQQTASWRTFYYSVLHYFDRCSRGISETR